MNINRKFCTKIALVLLGLSPIFWNTDPAHAVTGSLNIDNTDFTIDPFSQGQGYGVNNAAGDSTIDNTATPNGFGDHFSDSNDNTFLLLGATDPDANITGTPTNSGQASENTDAWSTTFEIDDDNLADGLDVKFDWAFQGNNSNLDSFVVAITNSDFSQYLQIVEQETYDVGTVDQSFDVSSLATGTDYRLYIALTESPIPNNSAAGFDNISVAPTSVGVPFEFSPSLGLLMMGGLFAGSTYLKRRKLAAKLDIN